jgi:glycosyltransferase involved in cell wall biosynthesis
MRILQVSPFFAPSMGGTAQVVYHTATHLARAGHSVTVVAGDHGSRTARFPVKNFQEVLLPSIFSRWGFYLTPSLYPWIRDHLDEYDIVHLHTVRTFQNILAHRAALRHRIPYVISAHGTLPVIIERRLVKRIYDLLFGGSLKRSARRWIAVSSVEVEWFKQAGIDPKKIRLIPNGLDLEEFSRLPDRGFFRGRAGGIRKTAKLILFLGRLHRRKGIPFLIRAFSELIPDFPDCCLVIAGPDDGEMDSLQGLVRKLGLGGRVFFPGALYGTDRLNALVDADVMASPATQEIFGLVPFEALLCGTPVIVGDDCGDGRLIRAAQAGYSVPFGDVPALANTLRRIFNHPGEADKKVKAGQAYIRKNLDWKKLVTDLENVYREIL